MKIIQTSDFHINEQIEYEDLELKFEKLFYILSDEIEEEEEVVFCVCGDIVDKGSNEMFEYAEEIFNYIEELFSEYNLSFEFVPGNHDLCNDSFEAYNNFISKFINNSYQYNNSNPNHLSQYNNINFILLNSVYHKDKDYGKLNLDRLDIDDIETPTLLVVHHTLLSENDDDISAIRNSYKLLELVEDNKIIGLLHGHTHGYKDVRIGKNCKVIGVGPMFKDVPNINNQFNFIELDSGYIQTITNYRYNADLNKYTSVPVYKKEKNNIYQGESIKEIYEKVLGDTRQNDGSIYNLKINIISEYNQFKDEISSYFSDDIDKAKDWQAETVPENLYYNHGKYMKSDGNRGMDFVIDELKNKATSSRAIIPLIDFDDVYDSGDNFLPSLDIIQFGFANEEKSKIYVTIYLRALEVNHFLKINLCEIYVMLEEIIEEIRSIEEVNITILAFRAQYKEKYGCFRKAQIDSITESKLMIFLIDEDFEKIIDLLNEKLELRETVIQDKGLKKLKNALDTIYEKNKCSKQLLALTADVIDKLNSLKSERKKTSNYSEIRETEKLLEDSIKNLIEGFKNEKES
jgi:hypothetical protein